MATALQSTPTLQAWLDDEFVPLERAALDTYLHLNDCVEQAADPGCSEQSIALVCAAISTVAPVYMTTAAGKGAFVLSAGEVEELILRPLRRNGRRANLEGLRIQRRDLHKAMTVLKEARTTFLTE